MASLKQIISKDRTNLSRDRRHRMFAQRRRNGDRLIVSQQMTAYKKAPTTGLNERCNDQASLIKIERIQIKLWKGKIARALN